MNHVINIDPPRRKSTNNNVQKNNYRIDINDINDITTISKTDTPESKWDSISAEFVHIIREAGLDNKGSPQCRTMEEEKEHLRLVLKDDSELQAAYNTIQGELDSMNGVTEMVGGGDLSSKIQLTLFALIFTLITSGVGYATAIHVYLPLLQRCPLISLWFTLCKQPSGIWENMVHYTTYPFRMIGWYWISADCGSNQTRIDLFMAGFLVLNIVAIKRLIGNIPTFKDLFMFFDILLIPLLYTLHYITSPFLNCVMPRRNSNKTQGGKRKSRRLRIKRRKTCHTSRK